MRNHGAFILARYSTENQNADTIEVQVQKCTQWCESNRLTSLGGRGRGGFRNEGYPPPI